MDWKVINSKKSFFFYAKILVFILIYGGLGIIMIHDNINVSHFHIEHIIFLFFGVLFLLVAFLGIYQLYKNIPQISITRTFITFNHKKYDWSELIKINLEGKQPFSFLLTYKIKGAELIFKDGSTKYIYDVFYENAEQIKEGIRKREAESEKREAESGKRIAGSRKQEAES